MLHSMQNLGGGTSEVRKKRAALWAWVCMAPGSPFRVGFVAATDRGMSWAVLGRFGSGSPGRFPPKWGGGGEGGGMQRGQLPLRCAIE